MFTWLLYLVLILMAVCAFFVVFNLLGLFISHKLKGIVAKAGGKAAKRYVSHMNPLFKLLMKSKKIQKGTDEAAEKQANKQCKRASRIFFCGAAISLALLIALGVLAETLYEMNLSATSTTSVLSILTRSKDCTCYVKCTNDADDDHKATYELLFGPTEFATFTGHMKLSPKEKDEWQALYPDVKSGKTRDYSKLDGKKQNEFIAEHLNDKMVDDYKTIIQDYQNFMKSADGKDRMKMSNDDLMADLKKMCKDYKVNGRNPNCKVCKSANTSSLRRKCNGMNKWVKGWTWQEIADANGNNTNNKNNGSVEVPALGHASGKYAVTLGDGNSYYWYHQSSEACKYNVIKYGQRYSDVNLGGRGSAASRGCSSYATAMAVSNVLGMEVTPFDILEKVDGVKPSISGNGTITYYGKSPINFCGQVNVYKDKLADKLADVYGKDGLKTAYIGQTQKEFDKYLDKGALIIVSLKNPGGSYSSMPWYRGDGHYIVIRKKENDKYYHLNSCVIRSLTSYYSGSSLDEKAKTLMNIGVSWSQLSSHFNTAGAVAVWSDNKVLIDGDDSTGTNTFSNYEYNKDVLKAVIKAYEKIDGKSYKDLADIKKKSTWTYSKVIVTTVLFTELSKKYGIEALCGIGGNIAVEGASGLIEDNGCGKAFSLDHKFVKSDADVDKVLAEAKRHALRSSNVVYTGPMCDLIYGKWTSFSEQPGYSLCLGYKETDYSLEAMSLSDARCYLTTDKKSKFYIQKFWDSINGMKGNNNVISCSDHWMKAYERCVNRDGTYQLVSERRSASNYLYKYLKDVHVSPTIGKNNSLKPGSSNNKNNNSTSNNGKITVKANGWTTSYKDLGHKAFKATGKNAANYQQKPAIETILKNTKDTKSCRNGSEAVIYACQFVGNSYVYGGSSLTNGIDCSGFVKAIYAHFGVNLHGNSKGLRSVGVEVAEKDIQPGDIVCYEGHVALYIGGGKIVHAARAIEGIKIGANYKYHPILHIRRVSNLSSFKSKGNLQKK